MFYFWRVKRGSSGSRWMFVRQSRPCWRWTFFKNTPETPSDQPENWNGFQDLDLDWNSLLIQIYWSWTFRGCYKRSVYGFQIKSLCFFFNQRQIDDRNLSDCGSGLCSLPGWAPVHYGMAVCCTSTCQLEPELPTWLPWFTWKLNPTSPPSDPSSSSSSSSSSS